MKTLKRADYDILEVTYTAQREYAVHVSSVTVMLHAFLPQGEYNFKNRPVVWRFSKFPVAPYGHYLMQVTIGPRGRNEAYFCKQLEGHIIPRPHWLRCQAFIRKFRKYVRCKSSFLPTLVLTAFTVTERKIMN